MPKYNWVTVRDLEDWLIEYDPKIKRYRVSFFEHGEFKDEVIFKAYDENENQPRIYYVATALKMPPDGRIVKYYKQSISITSRDELDKLKYIHGATQIFNDESICDAWIESKNRQIEKYSR